MTHLQLNMNRSATFQLRAGFQRTGYPTHIRYIDDDIIKALSPLENGKPLTVPCGEQVIIQEVSIGSPPESSTTSALEQYWDELEEEWILILPQPFDRPLAYRQLFREDIELPFTIKGLVDPEQPFEAISINLSGSGVLLALDLHDRRLFQAGETVALQFELHAQNVGGPFTFKGKVVRRWETQVLGQQKLMLGIAFNEQSMAEADQQLVLEYLVKAQVAHYADFAAVSHPMVNAQG